jgi:hypothetical protein
LTTKRQSHSYVPIADWLFSYQKDWLRPDLIAGLTAAAVVIPKAMAYATVAGLPVQVGLYTALVPMAIYAAMGTSRPLSVSTTTTIAVLTAAELGESVPGGAEDIWRARVAGGSAQCPVFRRWFGRLLGQIEYLQFESCDSREPARCWRSWRSKALARHQTVAYNPGSLMWPCAGGHSIPPCAMFE